MLLSYYLLPVCCNFSVCTHELHNTVTHSGPPTGLGLCVCVCAIFLAFHRLFLYPSNNINYYNYYYYYYYYYY